MTSIRRCDIRDCHKKAYEQVEYGQGLVSHFCYTHRTCDPKLHKPRAIRYKGNEHVYEQTFLDYVELGVREAARKHERSMEVIYTRIKKLAEEKGTGKLTAARRGWGKSSDLTEAGEKLYQELLTKAVQSA